MVLSKFISHRHEHSKCVTDLKQTALFHKHIVLPLEMFVRILCFPPVCLYRLGLVGLHIYTQQNHCHMKFLFLVCSYFILTIGCINTRKILLCMHLHDISYFYDFIIQFSVSYINEEDYQRLETFIKVYRILLLLFQSSRKNKKQRFLFFFFNMVDHYRCLLAI